MEYRPAQAAIMMEADYLPISCGALVRLSQDFLELGGAVTAAMPFLRNNKNAAFRMRIRAWEAADAGKASRPIADL